MLNYTGPSLSEQVRPGIEAGTTGARGGGGGGGVGGGGGGGGAISIIMCPY